MPRSLGVTSLRASPRVWSNEPYCRDDPVGTVCRLTSQSWSGCSPVRRTCERSRAKSRPLPTSVRRDEARFIARQPWNRTDPSRALSVEFGSSGFCSCSATSSTGCFGPSLTRNATSSRSSESSKGARSESSAIACSSDDRARSSVSSCPASRTFQRCTPGSGFRQMGDLVHRLPRTQRKRQPPKTQHYQRWWTARRWSIPRLIEAPKSQLRRMQRKVLHELLERVPFHPAAHGGVRGRSAVTHASLHTGRRVVAQFDLADFFARLPSSGFQGLRGAGVPQRTRA